MRKKKVKALLTSSFVNVRHAFGGGGHREEKGRGQGGWYPVFHAHKLSSIVLRSRTYTRIHVFQTGHIFHVTARGSWFCRLRWEGGREREKRSFRDIGQSVCLTSWKCFYVSGRMAGRRLVLLPRSLRPALLLCALARGVACLVVWCATVRVGREEGRTKGGLFFFFRYFNLFSWFFVCSLVVDKSSYLSTLSTTFFSLFFRTYFSFFFVQTALALLGSIASDQAGGQSFSLAL